MVQVPTGNVVFEKLMLVAAAVAVTLPPQLFTTLGVVATTRLVGSVSVKLASIGTTLPLVMLKVMVLATLVATVVGLKLLVMDGGSRITMLALAVPPLEGPRPAAFAV